MKYFDRGRNIVHATNSEYIKGNVTTKSIQKICKVEFLKKYGGRGGGAE